MINSSFPGLAAVPSGWPTLLGLLCILGSKTRLIPISPDQIACEGKTLAAGAVIKEAHAAGAGQKAQPGRGRRGGTSLD